MGPPQATEPGVGAEPHLKMKRLIQWSIDHHWMVMVFSALLLVGGIWTASEMPVDVFPDLTAPTVTILTEGHGMARRRWKRW